MRPSNDVQPASSARIALNGFREAGVGVLPGLLPETLVRALCEESLRMWAIFAREGAPNLRVGLRVESSGQVILNGLDPVSDVSAVFARLNAAPLLLDLAEQGLGGPATTMKDKLIYKWPGTPGFGLHRDGDYNTPRTGVSGAEAMTVCIALDRVTLAKGPIEFFPDLRLRDTAAPASEPRDVDECAVRGLVPLIPELQPGDAVVFDGRVPHRSGRNTSKESRRLYMVTYVPARYAHARGRYYAARAREESELRERLLS